MMGKSFPFRYSGERTLDKIGSLKAREKGEKVHTRRASLQKIMMDDCSIFLACQAIVKDYQCPEVVLEPLPGFQVLKNLVVDIDPFLERIQNLRPFLIASAPPEKERKQTQEEGKTAPASLACQ